MFCHGSRDPRPEPGIPLDKPEALPKKAAAPPDLSIFFFALMLYTVIRKPERAGMYLPDRRKGGVFP